MSKSMEKRKKGLKIVMIIEALFAILMHVLALISGNVVYCLFGLIFILDFNITNLELTQAIDNEWQNCIQGFVMTLNKSHDLLRDRVARLEKRVSELEKLTNKETK